MSTPEETTPSSFAERPSVKEEEPPLKRRRVEEPTPQDTKEPTPKTTREPELAVAEETEDETLLQEIQAQLRDIQSQIVSVNKGTHPEFLRMRDNLLLKKGSKELRMANYRNMELDTAKRNYENELQLVEEEYKIQVSKLKARYEVIEDGEANTVEEPAPSSVYILPRRTRKRGKDNITSAYISSMKRGNAVYLQKIDFRLKRDEILIDLDKLR